MSIVPGNGIFIRGCYEDGSDNYERPYLVIENNGTLIKALNVSSLKGKEHKLSFPSNKIINKYKPPFVIPSFVKLDVLYEIELFSELSFAVVDNGSLMEPTTLQIIQSQFAEFANKKSVLTIRFSKDELLAKNPKLQIYSVKTS